MPIIDGARMPLHELAGNRVRQGWSALWLKLVRPLLLVLCWGAVGHYAWRIVSGEHQELPLVQLLAVYAAAVLLILLLMLALVRRRRSEVDRERPSRYHESTLEAVSDLAQVPADELVRWQQSQRLVVYHDEDGAFRHAESGADSQRTERARNLP